MERSPHLAVPPRELAATITATAVLRAGWAVAGALLCICMVIWVGLWIDRGYGPLALLPIAALVATSITLRVLSLRPNWQRGFLFLAVGTVATFTWVYGVLSLDPSLNEHGIYLVNRMIIIMLLVGAVSPRLAHGVLWCTAGWGLGSIATTLAQMSLGLELMNGYGPILSLLIYVITIVMFLVIGKSQRRFTSAFSAKQIEPARITGQRELEERAVILLHDTVLNDLFALTHGKAQLDDRTRAKFREDIQSVSQARIEPESASNGAAEWLRREILDTISDFQWRGLRVDISGEASIPQKTSAQVAEALAGAIRSCLENVEKHSSSDSAELFVDFSQSELSVLIVDQGIGFDADAVPEDRLGIRQSIVQRIERVGGSVKIWSAAGAGTSVAILVPLELDHE